jgi:hypothetical protein
MIKEIWNKIEEELTGEFARGYALAQHIYGRNADVLSAEINRCIVSDSVCYEWGWFDDYGDSSPQEWVNETDFMVCTDEEADELAYENIVDSLWAFQPSFLAGETGLPEEVFVALVENGKYEDNNDTVASMIKTTCGLDEFVQSAISADGRGHFIAHYDHIEHEVRVRGNGGNTTFYIYKVN